MMPILCYIISRSSPPHLYSLLQFLYDFADEFTIKGNQWV